MSQSTFEELIERKRDGHEHTAEEIERIVLGFTRGEVPDYQMSAWLMAVVLRGLSATETIAMTQAMVSSGDVVDLSAIPGVKVDKHSTGGVADTTTLVLAPLVAACGVPVAKMSGRGLGHTGGTLDKLESIPGFRVELSPNEFIAQVQRVGVAVIAQSPQIDPADKKIYALRDVTGTVPSIPLIVGSIISKKVAGGADAIVLDVKVGSGAFMKSESDARQLAHELTAVGDALGRKVVCVMSDMDQPLGMAVGNALEVAEAIQTLRGEGPDELTELCLVFGAKMLVLGGKAADEDEALRLLGEAIATGAALRRFREWVSAQGGDPRVADDLSLLPRSPCTREVRSPAAGWVSRFDTEGVGRAAMLLGAGRARVGDVIDPGAGLLLAVRIGVRVESGDLLCTMCAASERLLDDGEERFRRSVHLSNSAVTAPPLFHELQDAVTSVRVVVGHANPDFDAYASTIAGTKLYPGSKGVFLGSQNANVRAFHNLHSDFLDFVDLKLVDPARIDSVVMVDTRDPDRLAELCAVARRPGVEVIVYDHHPAQLGDVQGAEDHSRDVGATTSILVHEIRDRGIGITPLEASVMLLGIHEDTGSLSFPGSTAYDAEAAAWLMDNGADIEVLNQFLSRTLDAGQKELLEQLTGSLETWDINGQSIAVGLAEAPEYVDSAGVLTHYVVEDLGYQVAIAIVRMPGRVQVVARSRLAEVDVGAVMARLGGGGHPQAASARFRQMETEELLGRLREALVAVVAAPLRARDVMTSPVRNAEPSWSMRKAGEVMATWGHGGLPVIEDGRLVGLVTRKDVDKAARHGLDHAPVTGFMNRDLLLVAPDTLLTELETLLGTRGVGRLPVMDGLQLVGIVTRKDVLRAEHGDAYLAGRVASAHPEATERFRAGVETLLPPEVAEELRMLGREAAIRQTRAFVVGGFVRDMLLGVPNLDIDVVVEGDGIAFAEAIAAKVGADVKVHRRFGTAIIAFAKEFHVDVASARTEYYARPGALPTVELSSLRQDLFRRDFTINAMAACLEPGCFGAVSDPFGGLRDLDAGTVRVLHSLSFVDDPTRVLRAARFESRYGFSMDEGTERLARHAAETGMLEEVSGARIREELAGILAEKAPSIALARLAALEALAPLLPQGSDACALADQVTDADESLAQLLGANAGFSARRATVLMAVVAASGSRRHTAKWLRHMHIGRAQAAVALELAERGPLVLRAISSPKGLRDSRLYRLLHPLNAETLVVLWARSGALARERVERFLGELAGVRLAVSGADLIAMGAAPGVGFSAILARALDDRLDGRARGREAELANLRRLAIRAGLIGPRKERV